MSIRDLLAAHRPIAAAKVEGHPGLVAIKHEELQELMELAHEAVHPQPQSDGLTPAERLLAAVFAEPETDEDLGDEGNPEQYGKVGPEEPQSDDTHLRLNALHLAVQVVATEIQAAHGLDSSTPDAVVRADQFLAFLKG